MSNTCKNCEHRYLFNPRPDEIERYGAGVMGCKRPRWESYTNHDSSCEAFRQFVGVTKLTAI